MSDQLPLFSGAPTAFARTTDPETSREAARALDPTDLERRVLDAIRTLGGATIHEVAEITGLPEVSVSPRFRPLASKGLIEESGAWRRNPSGRRAIVWVAT